MVFVFLLTNDIIGGLSILFSITIRYLLFAGLFYSFFYIWKNNPFRFAKIQQRYPENKFVIREIAYSFLTILIFGAVILAVTYACNKGYTRVYHHISAFGYTYYFLSIILMVFLHDTYFYWAHRAMHWKPLFKTVHKIHHLSTNPTPFAAYAFHPLEALVEVGIIPLIAFCMPYHPSAIAIFTLYSLLLNVMGHLGFELFPKGFTTHKIFKLHNTSTHHNMHHRLVKCNYGLYFNIWDRLMKTNHAKYEQHFEEVTAQEKLKKPTSIFTA